jgi:hypothetical protein
MISHQTLIERVLAALPAVVNQPPPTYYDQAVKDAVVAFSRRLPLHGSVSISVTPGVAEYALPADFLSMIALEGAPGGGLIITDQLVPVSNTSGESIQIRAEALVIVPTPEYSATRRLTYNQLHTLNESLAYPYMRDMDARAVVLRATADILAQRAARAANTAVSYAVGNERVDKTDLAPRLWEAVRQTEAQYEKAIAELQSAGVIPASLRADGSSASAGSSAPVGMRARYSME